MSQQSLIPLFKFSSSIGMLSRNKYFSFCLFTTTPPSAVFQGLRLTVNVIGFNGTILGENRSSQTTGICSQDEALVAQRAPGGDENSSRCLSPPISFRRGTRPPASRGHGTTMTERHRHGFLLTQANRLLASGLRRNLCPFSAASAGAKRGCRNPRPFSLQTVRSRERWESLMNPRQNRRGNGIPGT